MSRRLAAILMCVLIGVVATGCGDDDGLESHPTQGEANQKAEAENFSKEPVPFQVHTGYTSGYHVKEPTTIIARNDADLKELKAKQFSNGVKRDTIAPVDFPNQQIVAVFLPKSEPGTSVTITDVFPEGGQVHVKAVKLVPGEGCDVKQGSPYPFHWVGTREMQGSPDLELVTQRSPRC
jgi:hypothetical protein